MRYISLFILGFLSHFVYAQNNNPSTSPNEAGSLQGEGVSITDNTVALLRTLKVNEFIVLYLVPSDNTIKLRYQLDGHSGHAEARDLDETLNLGARDASFNVVVSYINPLKYRFDFAEQVSEDPTDKILDQFVTSATALAQLVQGIQTPSPSEESITVTGTDAARRSARATGQKVTVRLYAPDMIEWLLHYYGDERYECLTKNAESFIEALEKADNSIYSKPNSFQKRIKNLYEKLEAEANTLQGLAAVLPKISDSLQTLETEQRAELERIKNVSGKLEVVEWLADTTKVGCESFKLYTIGKVPVFTTSAERLIQKRRQVLTDFKTLLSPLRQYITIDAGTSRPAIWDRQINVNSDQIKNITITVKLRSVKFTEEHVSIEEKDGPTANLNVRKYRRLIPEFAVGAIMTRLTFPQFGTALNADSTMVVADAGSDKVFLLPAGLYNLIYRWGVSQAMYPMLQFGVSTQNTRPVLLGGVGFRFAGTNHFAISGGAVAYWVQELDELEIGDPVGGTADIENDLKFNPEPRVRPYFSLQFAF